MSVKLDSLRVTEVSAVDSPANLLDGFMVYKARTDSALAKAVNSACESIIAEIPHYFTVERASASQPGNSAGRFRPAISGIDQRPSSSGAAAPAADVQPEDSAAEKHTGFFRPARGYRRVW